MPLWLRSLASSSLERSSPLQSCASPGEWLESFAVPWGLAVCWWAALVSMVEDAIGGVQLNSAEVSPRCPLVAAPPTCFRPLPQISYLPAYSPSACPDWWLPVGRWLFGTILICKNTCFGLVHIPANVPNASHRRLLTRVRSTSWPKYQRILPQSLQIAARWTEGPSSTRHETWHVVMPPFK